jgi:hypothetical protein
MNLAISSLTQRSLWAFSSYKSELVSDVILGGLETTGMHSCKLVLEHGGKHVQEELEGDQ